MHSEPNKVVVWDKLQVYCSLHTSIPNHWRTKNLPDYVM